MVCVLWLIGPPGGSFHGGVDDLSDPPFAALLLSLSYGVTPIPPY